jgi:transcriptional regulator with XRE-family HTH domain
MIHMNKSVRNLTQDDEREVLFDLRRVARLTQSDVAREVGLSQAMISLYESGRMQLKDKDLRKLKAAINRGMAKAEAGRLVKALPQSEAEMEDARRRSELDEMFARVESLENELADCKATINQLMATLTEHVARTEPEGGRRKLMSPSKNEQPELKKQNKYDPAVGYTTEEYVWQEYPKSTPFGIAQDAEQEALLYANNGAVLPSPRPASQPPKDV